MCLLWWLLAPSIMLSSSIYANACIGPSLLFMAKYVPLHVYTAFCLPIHQIMDIWDVSTFYLLWIMLLWTLVVKFLGRISFWLWFSSDWVLCLLYEVWFVCLFYLTLVVCLPNCLVERPFFFFLVPQGYHRQSWHTFFCYEQVWPFSLIWDQCVFPSELLCEYEV